MQGNIDMSNNKIVDLPDPTTTNEPISKQYANRVYLTNGDFTMQDNSGMNNHKVSGLNPVPSDGTAAVSKDYTESRYVVKDADIGMNNKRILNLPFPQTSGEPITKGFVEKYYGADYVNILTFKGKPGRVTVIHAGDTVNLVNGKPDVDFSKVGDSYQINFSVRPKLPTGIYTYEMDVVWKKILRTTNFLRDMKNALSYVTPYILLIGLICGAICVASHVMKKPKEPKDE